MTPENTRPLRRPKTLLKHKVLLNGQLSWNNHNKSAPDLHFTLDEGCRNIKGMVYLKQCQKYLDFMLKIRFQKDDSQCCQLLRFQNKRIDLIKFCKSLTIFLFINVWPDSELATLPMYFDVFTKKYELLELVVFIVCNEGN